MSWEKELLGIYLTEHPLKDFEAYLEKKVLPCTSLSKDYVGKRVKLGGIISKIQRVTTKNSESMLFVSLEDKTGRIEILVFPKLLDKDPLFWQKDKVVVVSGKINFRDDAFKLLCDEFRELTEKDINLPDASSLKEYKHKVEANESGSKKTIIISLPNESNKELFKKVLEILSENKGSDEVLISISNGQSKKVKMPFGINYTDELKNKLESILDSNSINILDNI